MKRNDPREPEHRLGGNVYTATYLEALIESWTTPRREPPGPSPLARLRAGIREALRRNTERTGDGLSSGGEQVGKGKGTHADPTASAAGRRLPEDKVDALVSDTVVYIIEIGNAIRAAESRMYLLLEELAADEERVNSVAKCLCCEGPAVPVKAGYCEACYKAWTRAERPEHFGFRRERRAWLASKERPGPREGCLPGEAVAG